MSDPSTRRASRSAAVETYVDRRVGALVHTAGSPGTRATLARLRGAVGRAPGTVPEVWSVTVDGAPGHPRGDEPTPEERAIHLAMTLFAVHQQSRTRPMHVQGRGLGQAVRLLERARGDHDTAVSPVRRRFDALATATSLDEAAHHLRGLVGQLRSTEDGIALDYGALAADLLDLQVPSRAAAVRLRWARQYYRLAERTDATSSDEQTGPDGAAEPGEETPQ